MRTWKLTFTACLLMSLSAMAQQQQSSPQNAASQATEAAQPASAQAQTSSPAAPQAAPSTLDQVVDRALEREAALIKLLEDRTPLIETYLQNLKPDPQLGPVPKEDHYFLGRMDMGETVDRRDYLSKDTSFQNRLTGGFGKLFKFEYKPMGFSWMVFAD